MCRFDAQTGADREVQRILLELLNQMDGFDQTTNVKVGDGPPAFCPVLGIRDILVRILIRGSVPLTNGSGCGSGRPKNVRIRIRNTGAFTSFKDKKS